MASCQNTSKTPAIDMANFDLSVAPDADFYQYATGGWQKNNPLKPEYSRYGSFDVLRDNNEKRINELFSEMTKISAAPGSVEQKISDLYKMGLDSTRLNAEGCLGQLACQHGGAVLNSRKLHRIGRGCLGVEHPAKCIHEIFSGDGVVRGGTFRAGVGQAAL